ncbi:MAG: ATP synthase subunit I [Gammaproteobacteria bacterium]|nr:ATP synthase subunit I [Gammaproteobacteria bacterium]
MSNTMTQKGRTAAYKILGYQLGVLIFASLWSLFWGVQTSLSLFLGGMAIIIPSLIFVYKVFQHSGAQASRQVLHGFYKGEALKFFLAIVMFVIVLKWLSVSSTASLIGFVVAAITQMMAPFLVKTT